MQRGQLLLQQGRYVDAERELRQNLGQSPNSADVHALLSLALLGQDKLSEAQEFAEQAIGLSPDYAFAHYCRSLALTQRRRFPEAEVAARSAVQLNPADADYWAHLASVLQLQKRWADSLEAAELGLQNDAEHIDCSNARAEALRALGRKAEALTNIEAALSRDPENADTHAVKGWALLQQGQPQLALDSFREALRINPELTYAQRGIVEALKARNPLYRMMLGYFIYMAQLNSTAQWGLLIGAYLGMKALRGLAQAVPGFSPWIKPVVFLYLAFVLLTWFSMPLFNLLLRTNRFGRLALDRDSRVASNWFAVCIIGGVLGLLALWLGGTPIIRLTGIVGAVSCVSLALPLVSIYSCEKGWPRRTMTCYAGGVGAIGLWALAGVWMFSMEQLTQASMLQGLSLFVTPWVANYLASQQVQR